MEIFLTLLSWGIGLITGYVLWAPDTDFKKAFVNGLSFKFIWGKWIK